MNWRNCKVFKVLILIFSMKKILILSLVLIVLFSSFVFAEEEMSIQERKTAQLESTECYQNRGKCQMEISEGMIETDFDCEATGGTCYLYDLPEGVSLDKEVYEQGDYIKTYVNSPIFGDCSEYLIDPSGRRIDTGSGGCNRGHGPTGHFLSDSHMNGNYGIWTYGVTVTDSEGNSGSYETTFEYRFVNKIQSRCVVGWKEDSYTCEFLGTDYIVVVEEESSCPSRLEATITYGDKEEFISTVIGERAALENGVNIMPTGIPCSVDIINLEFSKYVEAVCGDGICEAGDCEEDCLIETVMIIDVTKTENVTADESVTEEVTCDNGCYFDGKCLSYGLRAMSADGDKELYCDIEGGLELQKDVGDSCQNNYECGTNFCSSGSCYDIAGEMEQTKGILESIMDFLRNMFGFSSE